MCFPRIFYLYASGLRYGGMETERCLKGTRDHPQVAGTPFHVRRDKRPVCLELFDDEDAANNQHNCQAINVPLDFIHYISQQL